MPAENFALPRTIALAKELTPDEADAGRGVPNYVNAITLSPDGTQAWVPSKKDNTDRGVVRDGEKLNTDNTVRTVVSRIDLATGEEDHAARLDLDNHDSATAAAVSPRGDLVFVASQGTNQVDVIDAYDGKLVAGFTTGLAPQGLELSASGKLFVQSFLSRTLDVYDVSGLLEGTDGAAHKLAAVETVADEPLAPEVLLGKQIFYNADTRQMSQDGYTSCASCHVDGGQDARVWDFTDRGEGLRNTITLHGRAGVAHGPVHWTGNFDEIQDFENDIRNHFGGSGFMTDEQFDEGDRSDPLGDAKAGQSESLDALAAFVASLDEYPRSPYRDQNGALTPEAAAGAKVYASLDCESCHSGPHRTDSAVGVLHDVGTASDTSGQRRGEPLEGLDTPTLIGLWATAPYLHDGSAPTLHDVLDNPEHGNAAGLSRTQKQQLVAYLLQLEGPDAEPHTPRALPLCVAPPDAPAGSAASTPSGGCGCRHAGGNAPAAPWALLVPLIIALRRRRAR